MSGSVMKGEHGIHVYFADKFVPKNKQTQAEQQVEVASHAFLKRCVLLNTDQIEDLPKTLIATRVADFQIDAGATFYAPFEDFAFGDLQVL